MQNVVLEVSRTDHGETRLVTDDLPDLVDGQVRLRVDSFAVTANNVTYAVAGDVLGYWDFFPAAADDRDAWGRVPVMGWADVVDSANADIPVGGRYFGWYPMAQYVTFDATATAEGFRDDGEHRAAHASVYRGYTEIERDPLYDGEDDGESRHALLRGLFLTGFLADEFFADTNYFDAAQVIVMSASSKTALGFAQRAAGRSGVAVVGVTSPRNADFVRSVGFYDDVVTYDDLASIESAPSVVIDMAGNSGALAAVHERLGDHVAHSMMVGRSHHDAPQVAVEHGPSPQMFFAPTEVARRLDEWGRDAYRDRTTEALRDFVEGSRSWLDIDAAAGPEETEAVWHAVRNGEVPPSTGCIASMHARQESWSA